MNEQFPDGSHQEKLQPFVYRSPFEPVDYTTAEKELAYTGTLAGVLDELQESLATPYKYVTRLVLHPPRIIRRAIDYKIANPDSRPAHELLSDAIQLGLHVYRNLEHSQQRVEAFREKVDDIDSSILTSLLVQKKDITTWEASHHTKSERTTKELLDMNRGDLFFIALAHGGVPSGMDIFLRYQANTKGKSAFYVARLSQSSSIDKTLQISNLEADMFREQTRDRHVVIYDEDQGTGFTMETAESEIGRIVRKPITTIANMGTPAGYFSD